MFAADIRRQRVSRMRGFRHWRWAGISTIGQKIRTSHFGDESERCYFTLVRQTCSMRLTPFVAFTVLLAGCATGVPDRAALNRRWVTTDEGYVYVVGYFKAADVRSKTWEAKRLAANDTLQQGGGKLVHRDVRWFEPAAPGQARCAQVVYSMMYLPQWVAAAGALEYERQQLLLEEPDEPILAGCGEKNGAKYPANSPTPQPRFPAALSDEVECDPRADKQSGTFHLAFANFVNVKTLVSPSFAEIDKWLPSGDPIFFVRYLATRERKTHVVTVARRLPNDGRSILVERQHAVDGVESCVTLIVRQGDAVWRKTIKRRLRVVDEAGRPPRLRLDGNGINLDAKSLQIDLARYLEIAVPEEFSDPAWLPNRDVSK